MAIIQEIDAGRYVWPHILDEIARALPDYTWLREVLQVQEEPLQIRIAGTAGSNFAITSLINLDLAAGDVAGAEALLGNLPADTPSGRLLNAMVAMRKGDVARARSLAEAIVAADPRMADGHNVLGLARLATGSPAAAIPHFETAQLLAPKVPVYAFNMATAYISIGEADAAAIAAEQARALGGDPAGLAELDVRVALARRDVVAAGKLLERVTPKDPESPNRLMLLAELHEGQGDLAGAAQALTTAFSRFPSEELAIRAAQAMQAAGRKDSRSPLEAWRRRAGPDPDIVFTMGSLALAAGDGAGAQESFEEALRLDPGHAQSLNNLAWLYNEARDPRAADLAERAYRAAPEDPRVLDTVGWVRLGAGRTAAAVEVLEKAAGLAPAEPDIQYHLAAALIRSGKPERARPMLEAALRSAGNFPSREAAAQALGQLGRDG